jgi:hypothetical protein
LEQQRMKKMHVNVVLDEKFNWKTKKEMVWTTTEPKTSWLSYHTIIMFIYYLFIYYIYVSYVQWLRQPDNSSFPRRKGLIFNPLNARSAAKKWHCSTLIFSELRRFFLLIIITLLIFTHLTAPLTILYVITRCFSGGFICYPALGWFAA